MAKKPSALLGATDPTSLKEVAIGSFLAFFVFAGAFFTAEATRALFIDKDTLIGGASYGWPYPGYEIAPSPGPIDFTGRAYTEGLRINPATGKMWADSDGDGKISAAEAEWWDRFFSEGQARLKEQESSGGGGGTFVPTSPDLYYDPTCLSWDGCGSSEGINDF